MELITRRLTLSEILAPDSTKELSAKYGIKENVQFIRKGIVPGDVKFYPDENASIDYITTSKQDRDREIILPKGIILEDYRANPVVLFGHNYHEMPVGKSAWIKQDGNYGLVAKTIYHTAPGTMGEKIFAYRKAGFPMAKSIGFIPFEAYGPEEFRKLDLEAHGIKADDLRGVKTIYPKSLLLEYSDVPVPSNPGAVQVAISKGLFTPEEAEKKWFVKIDFEEGNEDGSEQKEKGAEGEEGSGAATTATETAEEKEVVLKPETTDNYHRIPVKAKNLFVQSSFRTISLSAEQGIKAIIGNLKSDPNGSTVVHTYLFDVNKWTMERAQTWVDNHKKDVIVEEKQADDSTCECPECGAEADPDSEGNCGACPECGAEMKACGRKPKKSSEENATVEESKSISKSFSAYTKLGFDTKIENAKSFWEGLDQKTFDVSGVKAEPSTFELDIMAKFLECPVKDIFLNSYGLPGALIGCYLSAFDEQIKTFEINDIRNFGYRGDEHPNIYKVIQLNSEKQQDFLVDGSYYCRTPEEVPAIIRFAPSWGGIDIAICTSRENKDLNRGMLSKAHEWVKENNFLRGEKFALTGDFLDIKQSEDWTDLFLESTNKEALRLTADLINKKGEKMNNRGVLMLGPPGTGKTLSGRVLMKEAKSTFIWVSSKDFARGGATYNLGLGFALARDLSPSILFIEDIDTWLSDYSVDLLKTEMDGIRKSKGVVTILTSNYPERLPKALIDRPGRFHDVLEFNVPSKSVRKQMLEMWTDEGVTNKSLLDSIVEQTEGFSGAHMYELVEFARTISEDKEISIDSALQESLKKLQDQKELVSGLQPSAYDSSYRRSLDSVVESDIEFKVVGEDANKASEELLVEVNEVDLANLEKALTASMKKLAVLTPDTVVRIVDEEIKTIKGIVFD